MPGIEFLFSVERAFVSFFPNFRLIRSFTIFYRIKVKILVVFERKKIEHENKAKFLKISEDFNENHAWEECALHG